MSIAHVDKSKKQTSNKKMNKTMIVTNTVINYKLTSHVIFRTSLYMYKSVVEAMWKASITHKAALSTTHILHANNRF